MFFTVSPRCKCLCSSYFNEWDCPVCALRAHLDNILDAVSLTSGFGCKIWIQSKACMGIFFLNSALHVFNFCIKPVLTLIMQDVKRDLSRPRFSKVFFEGIQRHLRSWPLSLGWITHASGRGYSGSWRLLQTELRKKLKETFHVHCDRKRYGFARSSLFFFIQFFWSFDFFSIWFFSIVFWDWSLLFVVFGMLFVTCDGEK